MEAAKTIGAIIVLVGALFAGGMALERGGAAGLAGVAVAILVGALLYRWDKRRREAEGEQ